MRGRMLATEPRVRAVLADLLGWGPGASRTGRVGKTDAVHLCTPLLTPSRTEVPVAASRSARQRKAAAEAGDLAVVRIDVASDDSFAYVISCTECEVPRPGTGTRAWSTRRPGEDNGYMAAMDRWILHLTGRHPHAEAACLKYLTEAQARLQERRDARG